MIFDVFYVQCLYQKDLCRINSFGSLFCIRVYSKVFSLPIYWQKCFVLPTLVLGDVPELQHNGLSGLLMQMCESSQGQRLGYLRQNCLVVSIGSK